MNTARTQVRKMIVCILTALTMLSCEAATAQQHRSVRIVEGEVYIDDRRVPPEELPKGFNAVDITAHYTFSGDVQPVVRLGEAFYVVEGDRLRAADRAESESYFQPPRLRDFLPPKLDADFVENADSLETPVPPNAAVFYRQAQALREQAFRLEELQRTVRNRFSERHMQEFEQLANEMSRHASRVAEMADDLPRIKLEGYLNDVRQRNKGLFDQLVSERQLEQETFESARQIRRMSEGEARAERIEALRRQLDRIFELKQENRRREIEQLEGRLGELRSRLAERERRRDDIVERRLRELLREDEIDW